MAMPSFGLQRACSIMYQQIIPALPQGTRLHCKPLGAYIYKALKGLSNCRAGLSLATNGMVGKSKKMGEELLSVFKPFHCSFDFK
jgi:hypothetical protein